MESFYFWRTYSLPYQILIWLVLTLAVLAGLFCLFPFDAYGWNSLTSLASIPTLLDTYKIDNLRFQVNGYAYTVKEAFQPVLVPGISPLVVLFMNLVFGLAMALIATGISTLANKAFILGSVFLMVFSLMFGFEDSNALTISLMAIFILVGWYFNSSNVSPWKRVIVFWVLILAVFSLFGHFFTRVLPDFGMGFWLLTASIFIFYIAQSIPVFLVWLSTKNAQKGRSNLASYLWVSLFFLLNALLIFFKTSKSFGAWNGLIISPILLLISSSILGFYYFKKELAATEKLRFEGAGMWLYLGAMLLSFGVLVWSKISGNDAATEYIEDFTAYAHLSMGLCFLLHVLTNFIQPLKGGLAVYKVVFKPSFSPISIARVFGIAGVVILIMLKNNFSFFQYFTAIFASKSAYYQSIKQESISKTYALNALKFDALNHQSNTILAAAALNTGDVATAQYQLEQSVVRGGTPQNHVALARLFQANNKPFDVVFTLKKGLNEHVKSGEISTNLAWAFESLNAQDSALYYLENTAISQHVKSANLMAFWAKNSGIKKIDSLISAVPVSPTMAYAANLMAIKNRRTEASPGFEMGPLKKDSLLNVSQFAALFNATATNKPAEIRDLKKIADKNSPYFEDFNWAMACSNFYRFDKTKGLNQLASMAKNTQPKGILAARTLGVWALQTGLWQIGKQYLVASGDEASVALLNQQGVAAKLNETLKLQAESYKNLKPINALKLAPHNPYVLAGFCPKLPANVAYQYAFEAFEWQPDEPLIIETYIKTCLPMGMYEYALVAAQKLPKEQKTRYERVIFDAETRAKQGF